MPLMHRITQDFALYTGAAILGALEDIITRSTLSNVVLESYSVGNTHICLDRCSYLSRFKFYWKFRGQIRVMQFKSSNLAPRFIQVHFNLIPTLFAEMWRARQLDTFEFVAAVRQAQKITP